VQRALVETDGTQCGFCTPGFVMAMAAFAQTREPATDANIHEALAGNLCRCTGYRSIVDACRRVAAAPAAVAPPSAIAASPEYRHGKQLFVAPRSLADLLAARARYPDAPLLAGGTDLGLRFSKGREALPVLISTARAAELQRIVEHADAIEIGGAVTYTAALPAIDRHFQSFGALVRRIGSRQIRNLGTFAGNLATASPIGDTLPCLIALEASVMLAGGNRTLPVEDFITGYRKTALAPDEVIAGIRIPLLPSGPHFSAYKLSKRFDQDIAAVVAAFVLDVKDGCVRSLRAAFGGMADRAKRATTLEAALAGRPWTEASLADVDAMLARDFAPMSDQRAGGAYRLRAAAGLVRRLQVETTSAVPTRVEAL
jgi:xanthine dehydrogenase small subunit